jgi:Flp pilus assembly pilin Flp
MKNLVKRFIREEEGLETVEWTLMAALIVLGIAGIIVALRDPIQRVFTDIGTQLDSRP